MLVNRPTFYKSLSLFLSAFSASMAFAENSATKQPHNLVHDFVVSKSSSTALETAPKKIFAALERDPFHALPDTDALRYYAVRGEQKRMNAELKRLKTLYPDWQPPKNIFADKGNPEQELWDLFAAKKYKKLRLEIARKRREDHNYFPSEDLLNKLGQQEKRETMAKAWHAKNWDKVLELANLNPDLLISDDIELLWFIGEAYAQKEQPKDAYIAFEAALNSAKTQKERAATVEKAALSLSVNDSFRLLESARQLPEGEVLSAPVQDSIIRGALARSAHLGEQPPAAFKQQVEEFEQRAEALNNAADVELVAWAKFGQRDWAAADRWFAHALSLQADAKAAEGAILTAVRLKKTKRAEALSDEWLGRSKEIDALYLNVHAPKLLVQKPRHLGGDFLRNYARKTVELQSGEGGEALGWYAYNLKQYETANAWFAKAMEWELTETAVFGKTLVAQAQKDRVTFEDLHQAFAHRYASIAALKFEKTVKANKNIARKRRSPRVDKATQLRQKIVKHYKAKQYSRCLQLSRQLRQYGPLRAADQQMRGWCLLDAKRPTEAQSAFAAATRLGGKGKGASAYGQVLAALRSGKTNQALSLANRYSLTAKQRRIVDVELLTQRARAAFDNRDYAASIHALDQRKKLVREERNLTFMRGWSYYHSGYYEHARQIFASLDQQLSTNETRRGINQANLKLTRRISNEH